MEAGQFSKKLSLWQNESATQRTILQIIGPATSVSMCFNHTLKFISAGMLQTTFWRENYTHKKYPSNYGKHFVCKSKFKKKKNNTKNFYVNFLETQFVS